MCKFDEAFTEKEMLEETGYCKDCKIDCPNAGKCGDAKMKDRYSAVPAGGTDYM